ncbi:MAG: protein kinase domain-containing protein [Gemmatimonadaceae bacterium]
MSESLEQVQRAFTAYTVERELGTGGMATVYLAHDKKHDRKVAIKILHAELAAVLGAERFLQEIKLTANLQHPHILGLIDSGIIGDDSGELRGRPYYVMPFVEGESLRQRLDKEQQLPVSDAVRIATEVASALDYAHRHGVIHRDIKPENILLHDGSAIVADFGIALAVTQAGGARMTQTGLSLGTPSYMSPEQAMGERTITARSDIYSLGAVTYEMLAGEPPFTGPTVQAVVARVMTEEPRPLTTQRRSVPLHVADAVSRALQKVPADRFASAHEFAEALNNPSFFSSSTTGVANARTDNSRLRGILYGVTALAVLMTAVALWGWLRPAPPRQAVVVRSELVLDSSEAIVPGASWWGRLAISPDGSHLAYIGGPDRQLLIRPRNQLHATAIPSTAGSETPFFSPDGTQVGALAEHRIYIASIDAGPVITVTDTLVGVGGASWGRDGFIYADGAGEASLVRVEAKAGAVPKSFTTLDTARGEFDHLWPDVLPNGKGVLFTIRSRTRDPTKGAPQFAIGVAEIPSGTHRVLVNGAKYARYAASGHLLYVTANRTLMIAPFDQNSMKITGEPTALIEGIRIGDLGAADLAISETGTLVYGTRSAADNRELVWVTRDGKAQPVDETWQGRFSRPALSPDGKSLAIARSSGSTVSNIWIKQLDRGPSIKLTLEGSFNGWPVWTSDGRSVTYSSDAGRSGTLDLWTKRADGSAPPVLQVREKRNLYPGGWSPDGKSLIFFSGTSSQGAGDILLFRPGIDTVPVPLVATKFTEVLPALSPNGRWLAYTSDESGQAEIYVVPFPNTRAAKWAVSTSGGTTPKWSNGGKELFYLDATGNCVAVEVKTGPTFSVGPSTTLFRATEYRTAVGLLEYAVARDDRRFLMIRSVATNTADKLIVVDNWFEELKGKLRK